MVTRKNFMDDPSRTIVGRGNKKVKGMGKKLIRSSEKMRILFLLGPNAGHIDKINIPRAWGVNKPCSAHAAGSARDNGFFLARFARGRRERREEIDLFSGWYGKGALTLRPLRAPREKNFGLVFASNSKLRTVPPTNQLTRRGWKNKLRKPKKQE